MKLTHFTYRMTRGVIGVLFRIATHQAYVGQENFPQPPYILIANHISAFDIPLMGTICPHMVRGFAAAKHRRNPLFAPILLSAGVIWVRRGEVDRRALRKALHILREEKGVLGIFPEGTRARGPYALQRGKPGVAYLATRADVPLVPLGITGTETIKHNLSQLRRTRVRGVVGAPFRLPESGRVRGKKLTAYTDLIMQRIAEVLPEEYRGIYA